MAQLKFSIDDKLLKKFKQIVLAKHGKIDLKLEGEDAIKLYVRKYEKLLEPRSFLLEEEEHEPLKKAIGLVSSCGVHNALEDLKRLEAEEET